jgi:hypothetical protein
MGNPFHQKMIAAKFLQIMLSPAKSLTVSNG